MTGTVTFNGAAVEGATVSYVPEEETTGKGASGVTDAAGKYTLSTFANGDGAVPGRYQVTVVKVEQSTAAAPQGAVVKGEYDADYVPPDIDAPPPAPPKKLLPEKYGDYTRSGISQEVVEGENSHEIKLEG